MMMNDSIVLHTKIALPRQLSKAFKLSYLRFT